MLPMHRRGPLWSNLIVVVVKQICAGRCGQAERWSNTWLGRSGAELHFEAREDGAGKQGRDSPSSGLSPRFFMMR